MPNRLEDRKVDTYAHTLFEAALSEDRVFENLDVLSACSHAAPEFVSLVGEMVKQNDFSLMARVLEVYQNLIEANRAAVGSHVVTQSAYSQDLRDLAGSGVIGVHVTTAVPLNDELRRLIKERCEADFESPVFLIEHVDPTIIGGIVLSARGHHRDASVKMQLDNARKVMTQEAQKVEV